MRVRFVGIKKAGPLQKQTNLFIKLGDKVLGFILERHCVVVVIRMN